MADAASSKSVLIAKRSRIFPRTPNEEAVLDSVSNLHPHRLEHFETFELKDVRCPKESLRSFTSTPQATKFCARFAEKRRLTSRHGIESKLQVRRINISDVRYRASGPLEP